MKLPVLVLAASLVVSGTVIAVNVAALQSADLAVVALRADVRHAEAAEATAAAAQRAAAVNRDHAQQALDTLKAVQKERPAFLDAVKKAESAFASAKGKVDVTAYRKEILAAQETVLAEKTDPDVVIAQATAVVKSADSASAAVAAYDQRQEAERAKAALRSGQKTSAPRSNVAPSGDWFADARSRLNAVGGGGVPLVRYDGQCGSVRAVACTNFNGVISVSAGYANQTISRKNWTMVHELAHIYQIRVWDRMTASAGYKSLFGSNPELLANCMASARGYTDHGHAKLCTSQRITWARSLWSGVVPG